MAAVLIVALALLKACIPNPMPSVEELPPSFHSRQILVDGATLHYVESGSPDQPLILFIHGTPGSWEAFARYLADPRLNAQARLISVDRPGFGRSDSQGPVPAFADQSRFIGALFDLNETGQPTLLVGHSLGGALVYRLALDYPAQVGGVVSISAPLDPALSSPRWYNQLARIPGTGWLIGRGLATANDEMLPLVSQLQPIVESLPELDASVTIIHGARDRLVDVKNAEFAESALIHADVHYRRFEDDGHFIVWERHDEIVEEVLELIERTR
ncbi:MAG: alpha/beta hydrolase [Pseudomonadota bacterium]